MTEASDPDTISPADPRYPDVIRGKNHRWSARPDVVCMATSTEQVVRTVQEAVSSGRRLVVRSGGHCYENFVFNDDVEIVLDLSTMSRVYFDERRGAFAVEPGAELLDTYEALYRRWGVTVPGGMCHSVGVGGHIAGGGYGLLSRAQGLTSDHVHAVEVVVVDDDGVARAVVAGRDESDPHHDLWWAHTGGGGGNFGVVTRYWMRSPGADTADPTEVLPAPPSEVLVSAVSWDWEAMGEASFGRLVRNYTTWHERNSAPGSPYTGLAANLQLYHRSNGAIGMLTQMDATVPDAERLLENFLDAVNDGVGVPRGPVNARMSDMPPKPELVQARRLPWLQATQMLTTGVPVLTNPTLRVKIKSANLRTAFLSEQVDALYRHLTREDYENPDAVVVAQSYGGEVNATAPDATATSPRNSVMRVLFETYWENGAEDDYHLGWIRECYRDTFARTGGVPQHDERTEGCYVNFPDVDLGDPKWNTSGTQFSELYYGQNYARLQEVKRRWDPRDVFFHPQSVRPAAP